MPENELRSSMAVQINTFREDSFLALTPSSGPNTWFNTCISGIDFYLTVTLPSELTPTLPLGRGYRHVTAWLTPTLPLGRGYRWSAKIYFVTYYA